MLEPESPASMVLHMFVKKSQPFSELSFTNCTTSVIFLHVSRKGNVNLATTIVACNVTDAKWLPNDIQGAMASGSFMCGITGGLWFT